MLSALLCGANPAATPEADPPLASTPAPPPLTGDYRVRPKMSTKRTNTAASLRTLMGKKSRDSFFCSDAQQVELGAIGASDAAAAAAAEAVAKVGGEGSRRWWRTDGSKEGSVKSQHTKNASSTSSASQHSCSPTFSSSSSLYSPYSATSSPNSPSPPFAPLARLQSPHPYADTSVSASPQSYFDLPSRPDSVRSKVSSSTQLQGASTTGNSLGLRLDLSCLSTHELRSQQPRSPPLVGLPRIPSSSYNPSKRSSIESAGSRASPTKSASPLPPSYELAHPLQTQGSGATWRPVLAGRKESDPLEGVDRTSKAVRSLAQTLLAKLNFSTVYLCRVPVPGSPTTSYGDDDMTSLVVYQAGCGALPSKRSSSLLHARALSSSSGAIIYRRPQAHASATSSVHTDSSATHAGPSAHASGVLVEVLAGAGHHGERLVLAGFVSDTERRLGGEEVAVCKRVAAEIGRLMRKEEKRANMV